MKNTIENYLNLVVNNLINLDNQDDLANEFVSVSTEEAEKKGFFSRDFGMEQWDWPQGVGIFGLSQNLEKNREYIINWAKTEIAKGLPTKNINTICPLLSLVNFKEFEQLSLEWMSWIDENFPRTDESGLQHITSGVDKFSVRLNECQIWIDTLFMTVLFIGKMGIKYDNQKWINDSEYQFLLHTKYLVDRETGLFYHGYNFTNNSNFGGNFWCRGNSWFTMAVPLYLRYLSDRLPESIVNYLKNFYTNQVRALVKYRGNDNLWHTIINDSSSYTETSGSSGIIAGIYMGIQQGLIQAEEFESFCQESIDALIDRIDEKGTVLGVSAGTPISKNKEDYKNIITAPMAYGQAMMICALTEHLNYHKQKGQ